MAYAVSFTVHGYVYRPDGSPAAAASVSASCNEDSGLDTTGSDGEYSITLSITKDQMVTVNASRGSLRAKVSFWADHTAGGIPINLTLSEIPPTQAKVPELELLGLRASAAKVFVGDKFSVCGTVENTGDASATEVNVRVYVGDVLAGSKDLGSIGKGDSSSFDVTISVEEGFGTGLKEVSVTIKCEERVSDSKTVGTIRVSAHTPALALRSVEVPSEASSGTKITVRGEAENAGDVDMADVLVSVYMDGALAKRATIKELARGTRRAFEAELVMPEDIELGEHTILVVLDGDGMRRQSQHTVLVKAGLEVVEDKLRSADAKVSEVEQMLEDAANVASLEEERSRLEGANSSYVRAAELFKEGKCDESSELIDQVLSELEGIPSSARSKVSGAVTSKLEAMKAGTTDQDVLLLLWAVEEIIESAEGKGPLDAVRDLVRASSTLDSIARLSGAAPPSPTRTPSPTPGPSPAPPTTAGRILIPSIAGIAGLLIGLMVGFRLARTQLAPG